MKKVETAVTVTNTVAIVCIAAYFYKALLSVRAEMLELTDILNETIEDLKVEKMKTASVISMAGEVQNIINEINTIKHKTGDMIDCEEFDEQVVALEMLVQSLRENGIEINNSYPRYPPASRYSSVRSRPRKSVRNKRYQQYEDSESEYDQDDDSIEDVVKTVRGSRKPAPVHKERAATRRNRRH